MLAVALILDGLCIFLSSIILKNASTAFLELAILLSYFEMLAILNLLLRYEGNRFIERICSSIRMLIIMYIPVVPVCIVLAFTKI